MADPHQQRVDDLTSQVNNVSLDDQSQSHNVDSEPVLMQTEESEESLELPNILIIANVADVVFENAQAKEEFEAVFREIDATASFQYLKSFRRARIVFESTLAAARTRIHVHEQEILGSRVKCYFAQPTPQRDANDTPHLRPPLPEKQFLISPPASPPVGWEPVHEGKPVINYDLLSAIANLAPGEAHELHPPSDSQPGIVVHVCEDPVGFADRPKLVQTKCPERTS